MDLRAEYEAYQKQQISSGPVVLDYPSWLARELQVARGLLKFARSQTERAFHTNSGDWDDDFVNWQLNDSIDFMEAKSEDD